MNQDKTTNDVNDVLISKPGVIIGVMYGTKKHHVLLEFDELTIDDVRSIMGNPVTAVNDYFTSVAQGHIAVLTKQNDRYLPDPDVGLGVDYKALLRIIMDPNHPSFNDINRYSLLNNGVPKSLLLKAIRELDREDMEMVLNKISTLSLQNIVITGEDGVVFDCFIDISPVSTFSSMSSGYGPPINGLPPQPQPQTYGHNPTNVLAQPHYIQPQSQYNHGTPDSNNKE